MLLIGPVNQTFAGGCGETGDFVADAPATLSVFDCPAFSDTCPDMEGTDLIHNSMSYTNDTCTTEFTSGQRERMLETFWSFRQSPESALRFAVEISDVDFTLIFWVKDGPARQFVVSAD
ncbi:hypothetical protein F4778DRAFT_697108 [Xylariomycetidae sp. FL2044]|nr:hypothetical protein F4778DRAFT_697108 [Xylariomycetidae sp. FL2044]